MMHAGVFYGKHSRGFLERLREVKPTIGTTEEAVEKYISVIRGLVDIVPHGRVCALSSGGVDSCLLVKLLVDRGNDVRVVTAGVEGSADVESAAKFASEMGLKCSVVRLTKRRVEKTLQRIFALGISGAQEVTGSIVEYQAFAEARKHGKVAAGGNGADMANGGIAEMVKGAYAQTVSKKGLAFHREFWRITFKTYKAGFMAPFELAKLDKLARSLGVRLYLPFENQALSLFLREVDARLNYDPRTGLWKQIHRKAALRLGVPKEHAFRAKTPLQSGAGLPDMLREIACQRVDELCPDYGSNLFLGGKGLADDLTRYFLALSEEREKKKWRRME